MKPRFISDIKSKVNKFQFEFINLLDINIVKVAVDPRGADYFDNVMTKFM